jgi:hypothetical protein
VDPAPRICSRGRTIRGGLASRPGSARRLTGTSQRFRSGRCFHERRQSFALRISRTKTVASKLGVTTAKLNSGFRAARKALIIARIDKAVKDGDLTEEEAAELKDELDEEDLPGYKAGGGFGFGQGGDRGSGPRGHGK